MGAGIVAQRIKPPPAMSTFGIQALAQNSSSSLLLYQESSPLPTWENWIEPQASVWSRSGFCEPPGL